MIGKDKQAIREEALEKLLECSFRKDTPLMMKNDNGVFGLFFDVRSKGLSEFKYNRLWRAINQVIRSNDKYWMYRYWEFADQYFSGAWAYKDGGKEKSKFLEFHVAIGGLLALNEKFEWITHIASFTNCLPAKYFLIPSTFSEIFEWLQYFSQMIEKSLDLDVKYHLYSQYEGVRAGANLYKGIVRYLALMMCRLPEMDYNVRYVAPMDLPHVYGTASNEKKDFVSVNLKNIQMVESFKTVVKEQNIKNSSNNQRALRLLDDYITACRKELETNGHVDNNKIDFITSNLLDEFKKQQTILITQKNSALKNFKKQGWFAESAGVLEGCDFLEGRYYNNINRDSLMVRHIIVGAIVRYNYVLNTYCPTVTLNVRYRDISTALTKLCIPNDYVILVGSIGSHLLPVGYETKQNVHFVYSGQSEIIIMKKELLPYICFEENVCSNKDYKLIEGNKNKVLYSNIWKIREDKEIKKQAEKNKHFDLFVGCNVSICLPPKDGRKCIRIKAVDGITQDTFDLEKTMKITEYNV